METSFIYAKCETLKFMASKNSNKAGYLSTCKEKLFLSEINTIDHPEDFFFEKLVNLYWYRSISIKLGYIS